MGRMSTTLLMAALMSLASLSGCIFEEDGGGETDAVLAVFKFSPTTNIKAGTTVTFDASDSTPSDGSLTYRWNFDAEGSIDIDATGRTATWSFDEAKTYQIRLEVSNGKDTSEQTRELNVAPESAEPPEAVIRQYADAEDCEDESINEDRSILVWICARDKSTTDRSVTETVTLELDASDSNPGDSTSQYIPTDGYRWDLNLDDDKDNDGDSENDDDLVGETVQWANVQPGEYEIGLTVTNNVGMTDSTTIKVYVNYAGYWNDFEIGGNNSGNPGTLEFDTLIHYNKDSGNTIVKALMELEYPKDDDDCTPIPGANNCRAQLDIYAYNEDDEEADNTTKVDRESRDDGDCDGDQDCVHLRLSSYLFSDTDSTYGDGEWTMTIQNERLNDFVVDQFVIRLFYK
jgi:plastocyanin